LHPQGAKPHTIAGVRLVDLADAFDVSVGTIICLGERRRDENAAAAQAAGHRAHSRHQSDVGRYQIVRERTVGCKRPIADRKMGGGRNTMEKVN